MLPAGVGGNVPGSPASNGGVGQGQGQGMRIDRWLPWYGWLGGLLVQAYLLAPLVVYEPGGEWSRVYGPVEVARIEEVTQQALTSHSERARLHRQMGKYADELLADFLEREGLEEFTDAARSRFRDVLSEDRTYRDFQRRYRELIRRSKQPRQMIEELGPDPRLPPPRWRAAEDLTVWGAEEDGRRWVWEDRLFPSALLACYRPEAWWWRLPLVEGGWLALLIGAGCLRSRWGSPSRPEQTGERGAE